MTPSSQKWPIKVDEEMYIYILVVKMKFYIFPMSWQINIILIELEN